MRQVLDHLPARLGAVAARLRAHRHVLVVREFLAGRRAVVVALRAALAGGRRVGTVTGTQSGGQFATLRAIDARVHALNVIFVPLGDQPGAVLETGITLDLTVGTSLGAAPRSAFRARGPGRRTLSRPRRKWPGRQRMRVRVPKISRRFIRTSLEQKTRKHQDWLTRCEPNMHLFVLCKSQAVIHRVVNRNRFASLSWSSSSS